MFRKDRLAQRAPATEALADYVVGAQVGTPTLDRARLAVLDTLAVTLGGSTEPVTMRLLATLEPTHQASSVPLLWSDHTFNRFDAALVTGTASHVLDYDDVSMLSICHPSAPVLSALLSVRDWSGLSGRVLLEAFVIGTEVLIRLGQTMGFRHYQLGFHATATLGAVGAAAACARLMGLDQLRTRHALAIAASMSSGLQVNFGSMVKSLHVGLAASSGVRAVQFAAGGVEGAPEVFSGNGFVRAFSGDQSTEWPDDVRLGEPFVIDDPGFEQKRYPCCYMLHRMIEASLQLRREHGIALEQVADVLVDMPSGGTKPLVHPRPQSGLNALFSGPYAVLASLADGRVDLKSFTDAEVRRSALQQRFSDVILRERALTEPAEAIGDAPVTVTVRLRDGKAFTRTITVSPGSAHDPLTPGQLRAKWIDCLRRACPSADDDDIGALFESGWRLSDMVDAGEWTRAIRAVVTQSPLTCEARR
ncbi:MmgE/PrpD family protein [Bradyrhizobium sp. AS23.2]|uniref:MmgE/PrpD family protein n=1 Tax=Bradyrhizobium sp. AS23.2 TaxID=1680155 RepID=UPI001430F443|nr:MmgE/PrpD family protein [Bradyrhizobium sp. AS23.2]